MKPLYIIPHDNGPYAAITFLQDGHWLWSSTTYPKPCRIFSLASRSRERLIEDKGWRGKTNKVVSRCEFLKHLRTWDLKYKFKDVPL